MIPCIKESNALKEFLEIDKVRPDFYNSGLNMLEQGNLLSISLKDFARPQKSSHETGMKPYEDNYVSQSHIKNESLNKFLTNCRP